MKNKLKSVISLFGGNLFYKFISLVLAIVVWFIIVQYVNPEDTRRINDIKIQVVLEDSVPEAQGLVLVSDFDQTMSITYKASRDVISILDTSKITAQVDLSSVTNSGEYKLPIKIDTGGENITIVDQTVKEAVLKFEKNQKAQININVSFEGSVPDGYVKNDPVCTPNMIEVQGPESIVGRIVSADIKISEEQFTETKTYTREFEFVDNKGNIVPKEHLTTGVEKVDVMVNVLKTKTIPVTATIVNSSGGYDGNFAKTTISPATITIAGGSDTLDTLNSYDLGTIDVSEMTETFTKEYVISLQNGIKNVDGVDIAKVTVDFGDVRTKTIKFTNFQIENLPQSQKGTIVEKSLSINFRGIAADIEKINNSNVKIIVDFQNKEQTKGKNSVKVYAVIPETLKVGVLGKYNLTVDIS